MLLKGPARRFDHDECRALYDTGEYTQAALAKKYGVSPTRINQIVDPTREAKNRQQQAAWQASRTCATCGGTCTKRAYRTKQPRCRSCYLLDLILHPEQQIRPPTKTP